MLQADSRPEHSLAPQYPFRGRDQAADRDVGQKTVVNPVPGEADDQIQILHSLSTLQHAPRVGPIVQNLCLRESGSSTVGFRTLVLWPKARVEVLFLNLVRGQQTSYAKNVRKNRIGTGAKVGK